MYTFKLNAGIPSNAEPPGGWEEVECCLRGHFVGHFAAPKEQAVQRVKFNSAPIDLCFPASSTASR